MRISDPMGAMLATIDVEHGVALAEESLNRGVELRPEEAADRPFLVQLYRSICWDDLARTGWTDGAKTAFLASQFALQHYHFSTHYARSGFFIVTQYGGPIGRLYLERGLREYRIIDFALMPGVCGLGIGSSLLLAVMGEAVAADCAVTIHVIKSSRAQRLYGRLGFREIGESGPYALMEWQTGVHRLIDELRACSLGEGACRVGVAR